MTITNEEIQVWMRRSPVVGRTREYANKTGMPERLGDHCEHPDADLLVGEDGKIYCYRCGNAPPGIWITEQ